jgi:zinc transporter, ZIP family
MESEKKNRMDQTKRNGAAVSGKMIAAALIPIAVLTAMILFLFGPGQSLLNTGIALPEVTIERIEFQEGKIVANVRNTGPEEIEISMADVNDRIIPAAVEPSKIISRLAEAKVIIPFSWSPGVPYEIGITTSDGTRFSKSVDAAALAPIANVEQASFFALLGVYVGVIPVLIGLLWFPFLKRLSANKYNFFLSLTAGLLVFLGIDALVESNEIAQENVAGAFNGQVLIAMTTIVSFLALMYASQKLIERAAMKKSTIVSQSLPSQSSPTTAAAITKQQLAGPFAIALMIAIGIGLHNLGEGLAIGAAVLLGEVALSTFLIVGFALHNTTEGLAIVAPMAKQGTRVNIQRLVALGLVAGVPTIIGTWIGGFTYSPIAAIIFLSIGAGAIFQVVFSIASWMANKDGGRKTMLSATIIGGFVVGMAIMYLTGLLIP